MNKLFVGVPALALMIPASAAQCAGQQDTTPDHSVTCKAPKGYSKAGFAARAAKGQFYACLKNKKVCIIKYSVPGSGYKNKAILLYTPDFFSIPKSAHGWTTNNCGQIFRKSA